MCGGRGGYRLEVFELEDAAGRVLGRVEDHQPGAFGYQRAKFIAVEAEAVLLAKRQRYRPGAGMGYHRLVGGKAGVGVDDLVARARESVDRIEEQGLGAGGYHDLVRAELEASKGSSLFGDGGAQLRQSLGWAVARMSVGEGSHGGLFDVIGGREIGLTDLEMDDLLAGGLEFLRPPQYVKSRFTGKLSRSFMQHESMIASGGQTLHLKVSGQSIKLQPCKSFARTW